MKPTSFFSFLRFNTFLSFLWLGAALVILRRAFRGSLRFRHFGFVGWQQRVAVVFEADAIVFFCHQLRFEVKCCASAAFLGNAGHPATDLRFTPSFQHTRSTPMTLCLARIMLSAVMPAHARRWREGASLMSHYVTIQSLQTCQRGAYASGLFWFLNIWSIFACRC